MLRRLQGQPVLQQTLVKLQKFQNMLIYQGTIFFVPVGIETFGSWGDMGHKLIKDIGKKLKEASGELRSTFYLTQRISVALQRGNSSCVLGTVPFSKGLESIFDFECPEEFVSDT